MQTKLIKLLGIGKSVLLVGPTSSGKTSYINDWLSPRLEAKGMKYKYLKDFDSPVKTDGADILIVDEFETFFDKRFLEATHPTEVPYYEVEYVDKIKAWHKKLSQINLPTLYVLTRNDSKEIENIVERMGFLDWGLAIEVVQFEHLPTSK